jgi:RHS repeat-associated protein
LGTTTHTYDPAGSLLTTTTAAGTTTYGYDSDYRQTSVEYSATASGYSAPSNVTYTYDDDGNRTQMVDGTGTTTYSYDDLERLSSTTNGADATTSYGYDLDSNVTTRTYPNSEAVTYTYDGAGRMASVEDWLGHTTDYTYDADGNDTSEVLPNGDTSTQTFNHDDQLTAISDAPTSSPSSTFATFSSPRNADGQVASATDTGVPSPTSQSYSYDQVTRLISTGSNSYGYDAAGNPTLFGSGTTQGFNSAEQLTSSSSPGGLTTPTISSVSSSTTATSATVTWSSDEASSSYVDLGNSSGDYTLADGSPSAVTSHSVTISGLICGSTYSYQVFSATGGSGSTSSPSTFSTSTCSSGAGITMVGATQSSGNSGSSDGFNVALPSGIETGDQIIVSVTTVGGSAPATPTGYTLVSSSTSGYGWDPRVTVYRKTATSSESDPWIETGYAPSAGSAAVYRGVSTTSPIDEVSDTNANYVSSITSNPVTTSVPGERLVLAEGTHPGGGTPPSWTAPTGWTQEANNTSWEYMSSGLADSPTQPLAGGTSTPTATYGETDDPAVVLLELEPATSPTTSYSYDSIGDRTSTTVGSGSPSTFTDDQTGEMLTATEAGDSTYTYAYNGDGLRMSKTVDASTENFSWDALSTSLLADGSTYFIYGQDGSPLEQINGTTVRYYLHDQLGSTRALTNSSGTAVATFTYDAYGNLLGSTGSVSTPLGFAGAYTDTETGFLYLVHRYYDPATGQFLSIDPLVNETDTPYAYTGGDPVNMMDPNGMITCGPLFYGCGVFTDIQNAISSGVSWAVSHPEDVALAVGAVALLATGGGALLEASVIGNGLLTAGEVANAVSTATDVYTCIESTGPNQVVGCVGALSGGATGALGAFAKAANKLSDLPKAQRMAALEFGAFTTVSHYALLTNHHARLDNGDRCRP